MERLALEDLKKWFTAKDRKPLVLRGARQVGKSTLVRLFCEKAKLKLMVLNFEKNKLNHLEEPQFKIQSLIDEIELLLGTGITKDTLLFLDEIQEQPQMIKLLRYFYEERPDIPVIAAGSLLELVLKKNAISFPVGRVHFYYLGPMTFFEFLIANGETILVEQLGRKKISETAFQMAKSYFKKYLYIGGMPKAVQTFVNTKSMLEVREVQNQIIQTFISDFPKYNKHIDVDRIEKIFLQSALTIGKKVVYQTLDRDSNSKSIRKIIEILIDARILLPCYHSNGNNPLKAEIDYTVYKNYFMDIGLVNCMHGISFTTIEAEVASSFTTKGAIAEQFVAQHLSMGWNGPTVPSELFYWLKDKDIKKSEIDFIVQTADGDILPIEVKSETGGSLKSLFYFCFEKNISQALKLSLSPLEVSKIQHKIGEKKVVVQLKNIPIFCVEQLTKNNFQSFKD